MQQVDLFFPHFSLFLPSIYFIVIFFNFFFFFRLKEIMAQTQGMKFIINVSAMEGKFYRFYKSTTHPHTSILSFSPYFVLLFSSSSSFLVFSFYSLYLLFTFFYLNTYMAKAALNMMTRTSAPDFVKNNIFMNSVDPGKHSTHPCYTPRHHTSHNIHVQLKDRRRIK